MDALPTWLDRDSAAARLQRTPLEFDTMIELRIAPRPFVTALGLRWKREQIETLADHLGVPRAQGAP